MKDLFVSFMRTAVPLVAGWMMAAAGVLGIKPDSTATAAAATVLLTAAYYALFRLLEQLALRLRVEPLRQFAGVLLGWARPPQYQTAPGDGDGPPPRTGS